MARTRTSRTAVPGLVVTAALLDAQPASATGSDLDEGTLDLRTPLDWAVHGEPFPVS